MVNAFLDSGCAKTSLCLYVVKEMGMSYDARHFRINVFGTETPVELEGGMCTIILENYEGTLSIPLRMQVVPNPIPKLFMPDWNDLKQFWPHLKRIEFPKLAQPMRVGICLGQDLIGLTQILPHHDIFIPLPKNPTQADLEKPIARKHPIGWGCQGKIHPELKIHDKSVS